MDYSILKTYVVILRPQDGYRWLVGVGLANLVGVGEATHTRHDAEDVVVDGVDSTGIRHVKN